MSHADVEPPGVSYDQAMASACENDPAALVMAIAERLTWHLEEASREVGLTVPQAKLIAHLEEPTRMSDLAERSLCDPSSITSLVVRLERDGFVERVADADDGRVRRVVLTAAGRRVRTKFFARMAENPDPFEGLSDEQRASLVQRLAPNALVVD